MAFVPNDAPQAMVVNITAIELTTLAFTGYNPATGSVPIAATLMPGAVFVIPAVGEQWLVEKVSGRWFLKAKTPFQDQRQMLEPREGMTAVGGTGPTHVVGSEVHLPVSVFLGDWELRIEPSSGALQVNVDGNWTTVTGSGGGGTPTTITASSITDSTATGRSLITTASAAAGRSTLGAAASANAKGVVAHGTNAGAARPTGYASVEWIGSVALTNATAADTWVDTSS